MAGPTHHTSFYGLQNDYRALSLFVAFSLLCHLMIFGAILLTPDFGGKRRIAPSAVSVTMVSLPPGPPAAAPQPEPTPAPEPDTAAAPEPEPVEPVSPPEPEPEPEPEPITIPDPVKAEPVPLKKMETPPKKVYKPKTSLKKKTFKPGRAVKKAVARIDKKVAKQPTPPKPDPVASAIEKMRQKVAQTGQNPRAGGVSGGGGGGVAGNARALEMIDIYRQTVPFYIQKNWAFLHQLAGAQKNAETVLVLKILPSGKIADIRYEKKSGNRFLDDSAYKAVQKSDPLPPLPTGYRRPYYIVGVIFTPEGIQ